ncbi:MAG: FHA domain-containing protein [Bacteroidota bacterium]
MIVKCGNCRVQLQFDESSLNPQRPAVKCPKCGAVNRVPLNIPTEKTTVQPPPAQPSSDHAYESTQIMPSKEEEEPNELGWIIVHDENAPTQTFPLKKGPNVIGRKSVSKPADIMIETQDKYMSRNHCIIEVIKRAEGQGYEYVISDVGSTNGTFINADDDNRLKEGDEVYLLDGNTIQAGRTKMVLKTLKVSRTAAVALKTVIHTNYSKTIIA